MTMRDESDNRGELSLSRTTHAWDAMVVGKMGT